MMLGYYLHVSPVCHPSRQLLSCKTSDLQFVGVSPARFSFGREMEEGRSRVHVELQTKQSKYNLNRDRYGSNRFPTKRRRIEASHHLKDVRSFIKINRCKEYFIRKGRGITPRIS